jgi:hypothetical protein
MHLCGVGTGEGPADIAGCVTHVRSRGDCTAADVEHELREASAVTVRMCQELVMHGGRGSCQSAGSLYSLPREK